MTWKNYGMMNWEEKVSNREEWKEVVVVEKSLEELGSQRRGRRVQ